MLPRADVSDAMLIEECTELGDFLASYETGCQVLMKAEHGTADEQALTDARRRLLDAGQQWRASLHRVAGSPAQAHPGLLAKGRALLTFLTLWPGEDTETTALTRSVVSDLIRLLSSATEPPTPARHGVAPS